MAGGSSEFPGAIIAIAMWWLYSFIVVFAPYFEPPELQRPGFDGDPTTLVPVVALVLGFSVVVGVNRWLIERNAEIANDVEFTAHSLAGPLALRCDGELGGARRLVGQRDENPVAVWLHKRSARVVLHHGAALPSGFSAARGSVADKTGNMLIDMALRVHNADALTCWNSSVLVEKMLGLLHRYSGARLDSHTISVPVPGQDVDELSAVLGDAAALAAELRRYSRRMVVEDAAEEEVAAKPCPESLDWLARYEG